MPAISWESLPLLASYRFGTAAATSAVLTIPACELLQIQFSIESYASGGGIAALRFNGSTTVTEYSSEYLTWSTAAPLAPTNVLGTFGGFKLGANSVTVQRSGFLTIKNAAGSASHLITCASLTHAAATAASVQSSGGGKFTGAGQITSVQMIVDTGVNLGVSSSFAIFGMNP